MREYNLYVRQLDALLAEAARKPAAHASSLESSTNGEAKRKLRELVPLARRRRFGVFFTDPHAAAQAARLIESELRQGASVIDPSCGAGDLLIACCDLLPKKNGLRDTLKAWSSQLYGVDLHPSFIHACQTRLALKCIAATEKSVRTALPQSALFPNVVRGSAESISDIIAQRDCVVTNPPYSAVPAPKNVTWAKGKTSAAAVHVHLTLQAMKPGAKMVAILPDVLRSGSRYRAWRDEIVKLGVIDTIIADGRFDEWTDVHTFTMRVIKNIYANSSGSFAPTRATRVRSRVDNHFSVGVGPLVAYREPKVGPWLPYLTARGLPAWRVISPTGPKRRFSGRQVKAPFVAIRRTSRPEDAKRAVATVIGGKLSYAVENHLLVLKPRDGTLKSCRQLLDVLSDKRTTAHLNETIRCRHLTVSSVSSIPWP